MSREIHNQRMLDAARNLPGRGSPHDVSRGYVGWGPDEEATMGKGKTARHATWQDMLGAIQNPAREIHDFYFQHHVESEPCPCCDGSGKNRDFAELDRGFYRSGSGRWRGWSETLTQEEIDLLVGDGRLLNARKGEVTPQNLRDHLGRMGHDLVNKWILLPARAKSLGIPIGDCFECVGTGKVPMSEATIMLHAWTFDAVAGTSRVDTALDVRLPELDEIREFMATVGWEGVKRRFGWAVGDNMYPEIVYADDWNAFVDRRPEMKGRPSFRGRDGAHPTWRHFHVGPDTDLNLVFDCKVVAPAEARHETYAGSELPERFGLLLWMTHPRKGTDVVNAIHEATPEDAAEIKAFLRKSFEVHGRHFAWAVGRRFGNEEVHGADFDGSDETRSPFLPG